MRVAHGVISCWAPELVITRGVGFDAEILLAVYESGVQEFRGLWHIPGGYNQWPELGVQETCSRVAIREIGVDVERIGPPMDDHKWTSDEHPYGHPLSLYCYCQLKGPVVESATLRFVRVVDDFPGIVVVPHARFILKNLVKPLGNAAYDHISQGENVQRSLAWKLPAKVTA